MPWFLRLPTIDCASARLSNSELSVISISSRLAGKPVSVSSLMIFCASHAILQLPGRDVDRQRQRRIPVPRREERLAHDRQRQVGDHAGFLGDRDEDVGTDQAALRMLPARQHLEAAKPAGGQVDLLLEIGHDLAAGMPPRRPTSSSLRTWSSRSIDRSNQAKRLRPEFFAAYMAMSAERISASMLAQSKSERAMPSEALICELEAVGLEGLRQARRPGARRCARPYPDAAGSNRKAQANSSPPRRAVERDRAASPRRSRSATWREQRVAGRHGRACR